MSNFSAQPLEKGKPRLLIWLNRPLKMTLFSASLSTLITPIIVFIAFDRNDLGVALSIAVPVSATVSYTAGQLIFRYAAKLEQTNETLRQLNIELDYFTRAVSHDLKNPLASIKAVVYRGVPT